MKVTFSRFMTFIVLVEMTALLPLCIITMHYPPSIFMICWTAFWCLVEVMNIRLKRLKGKRESSVGLLDKLVEVAKDKDIDNTDVLNFIKEIKGIISE